MIFIEFIATVAFYVLGTILMFAKYALELQEKIGWAGLFGVILFTTFTVLKVLSIINPKKEKINEENPISN